VIKLILYQKDNPKNLMEQKFEIPYREILIGRGSESDIKIQDLKASRKHAVITYYQNKFYIKDLNSKNGTYLNGRKIQTEVLNNGDEIRVGDYIIKFYIIETPVYVHKDNDILAPVISVFAVILISIIFAVFLHNSKINRNNELANQTRKTINSQKAETIYLEAKDELSSIISSSSINMDNLNKIINKLENAKKYDSTNPEILNDLTSLHILKGDVDKVIDDINYVRKNYPDDPFVKVIGEILDSINKGGE